MMSMSKNKYDNFSVLNSDNKLIFRCSRKKADWYLTRNLAIEIDSTTIKLLFNTNGDGNLDQGDLYLGDKENLCVSCKTTKNLISFHVVPIVYRKWMPIEIKSHSFHDVVLLCLDCHSKYEPFINQFKKHFVELCGCPLQGSPYIHYPERKKVISASKTLKSLNTVKKHIIPPDRIDYLSRIVMDYFKIDSLTSEYLEMGCDLVLFEKGEGFKEHGQVCLEGMGREELIHFVQLWRCHFLKFVEPKFLNPEWKPDNRVFINDK